MKNIRVIGVGNTLLSDDGIGPRVCAELAKRKLPAGVQITDAGCALSTVLLSHEEADAILILDAVRGGGTPGDVYSFPIDELPGPRRARSPYKAVHEIGIEDSVALARIAWGKNPDITIIGIEPASLEIGMELSPALARKFGAILNLIETEVKRMAEGGK